MNLYLNEKFIQLVKPDQPGILEAAPDRVLAHLDGIRPQELTGKIVLEQTREEDLDRLLSWIELKKVPELETVVCHCLDYNALRDHVKSHFRIVKAAGGLVRKRDKFLLIYRLGKWDLPKGKLERGERAKEAAVREVEEECGVEAERETKLCTTWHTYMQEGKRILKKTTWYNMTCIDDSNMEPQYVENIEDIRWMTLEQARAALSQSYRSIQGVLEAWVRENQPVGRS